MSKNAQASAVNKKKERFYSIELNFCFTDYLNLTNVLSTITRSYMIKATLRDEYFREDAKRRRVPVKGRHANVFCLSVKPQILGLIPQSQVRKFLKVCQFANRKSANLLRLISKFPLQGKSCVSDPGPQCFASNIFFIYVRIF